LKSEHAVNSDGCEHQPEPAEKRDEKEEKAFCHPGVRGRVLQRNHFVGGQPVVGASERATPASDVTA